MWTIATFDKYNPEILIYLILQSDLLVYDPTSSLKRGSYCLSSTHNSAKLIAAGDFLYPFFIPSFLFYVSNSPMIYSQLTPLHGRISFGGKFYLGEQSFAFYSTSTLFWDLEKNAMNIFWVWGFRGNFSIL